MIMKWPGQRPRLKIILLSILSLASANAKMSVAEHIFERHALHVGLAHVF
ncbi:MAG TPA: hypothetical protein VIJ82_24050 [Streptosporangiaceae bacterium]